MRVCVRETGRSCRRGRADRVLEVTVDENTVRRLGSGLTGVSLRLQHLIVSALEIEDRCAVEEIVVDG